MITPEQRVIEYMMDDNNYLPGHAEVVVSIDDETWELVEHLYYKYRNANTTEDECICVTCSYDKEGKCRICGRISPRLTTEDDMRKHKWSEGETNQALTTEDEPATTIQHPCPTCGQETTVYLQQEDSDE